MPVYLVGITAIWGRRRETKSVCTRRSIETRRRRRRRRRGSQLWGITEARGVAMLVLRSESLFHIPLVPFTSPSI